MIASLYTVQVAPAGGVGKSRDHIDQIWAALREKVPNVLSRCHTKRRTGARGRDRPFFGMTPTFQKKKSIFFFKFLFSKEF